MDGFFGTSGAAVWYGAKKTETEFILHKKQKGRGGETLLFVYNYPTAFNLGKQSGWGK